MKRAINLSARSTTGVPRQHGVTLIEVLVSLIVLSVGLLGVAGLQGVAKQSSHQAHQRTQATQLVDGMIERIRANPTATADYATGATGYENPLGVGSRGDTAPSPNGGKGAFCTPQQLAAYDLWSWEQAIDGAAISAVGINTKAGGLISPRGCIVFDEADPRELTVILSWRGLNEITDAVVRPDVDNPDVDKKEVCGGAEAGKDSNRRQTMFTTYIVDEMIL